MALNVNGWNLRGGSVAFLERDVDQALRVRLAGDDGNELTVVLDVVLVRNPGGWHRHGLLDRLQRGGDHPQQREHKEKRSGGEQDVDDKLVEPVIFFHDLFGSVVDVFAGRGGGRPGEE